MLGLFISLFTFVSSLSPTHAATNGTLPPFEASITQCNGVYIPQVNNPPSWYLQGSTPLPVGNNGQFPNTPNNVNPTGPTFSLVNSNIPIAQGAIYNTNAPQSCTSSRRATTGPNTRIQVSWD